MKIYEMTATFGKLQHETLTLKPGLNIIEAPNEWGKSTWCAFLLAMLYGLDTRAKTTKTSLSDKEHYAPWSGQPMSGSMKLDWNGRKITIERSTKGRVPLGEFSAYETESGIPVPQLTADNCGEMLLGVEQAVFRRAGFVRLSDLPVTRDDALRRRLNALVTTGDESGDGERLARDLKILKNKCRYNKNGLLPQAEEERDRLRQDLRELRDLQEQSQKLCGQADEEKKKLDALENHLSHLGNQQASADALRVSQARAEHDKAVETLKIQKSICDRLPSQEKNQEKRAKIQALSEHQEKILEQQKEPEKQISEKIPEVFRSVSPEEAVKMVQKDRKYYEFLNTDFMPVWLLLALCAFAGTVLLCGLEKIWWAVGCLVLGALVSVFAMFYKKLRLEQLKQLQEKYGDAEPDHWTEGARLYFNADDRKFSQSAVAGQLLELKKQQKLLCGTLSIGEALEALQKVDHQWHLLEQAEKEMRQTGEHLDAVLSMARKTRTPQSGDDLLSTEEETKQEITRCQQRHQELLGRIGQYQGRMETLGTEAQLQQKLEAIEERISQLETYYEALSLAQGKLEEAAAQLQRRFAPRITQRAQELMSALTEGRYEKLTLEEDFSLNACAGAEDVVRSALFRSEGTMDQLYLSLRLAVSEALTPEAPLVLDDALVRFDGRRLKKALEILEGEEKQVILFTCQSREGQILPQAVTRKI